jgi:hypothetical protein
MTFRVCISFSGKYWQMAIKRKIWITIVGILEVEL